MIVPNDLITFHLTQEQTLWKDKLPELFISNYLLQENPMLLITKLDKIIKLDELQNGKYHDNTSRSDKQYATRCKFYLKFSEFVCYKDYPDLSWIYYNHRFLLYKILNYHRITNNSLWTVYNDIKCITRILKLFEEDTGIYIKFTTLCTSLNNHLVNLEEFNTLSNIEINRMIDWETLLDFREQLEKRWREYITTIGIKKSYSYHLDMLLLSLYTLTYPNRKEIMTTSFISSFEDDNKCEDFIYINEKSRYGFFILNKSKKKHDRIVIKLSTYLTKLLKESLKLYPRKYVFTHINNLNKQTKDDTVSTRLRNLFRPINKVVGVSSIRSSYISWLYRTNVSTAFLRDVAINMRTSLYAFNAFYRKISMSPEYKNAIIKKEVNINHNDFRNFIDIENEPVDAILFDDAFEIMNVPKLEEETPYQLNFINLGPWNCKYQYDYYEKNKEKMKLNSKKWYEKNKLSKYIKKILYNMNNDISFIRSIKYTTIMKWGLYFDGNEWKSEYVYTISYITNG